MRIEGVILFVHCFVGHSSRYYAGMVELANLIILVQILTTKNLAKAEVILTRINFFRKYLLFIYH